MRERAVMHCQDEIERDCTYSGFISDELMFRWANDGYSTSRHLLTLYSITKGLSAKTVLEIGFGRSSFVLIRAVYENGGHFYTCDSRDFSYLLSESERSVTTYLCDQSAICWQKVRGADFAFLDYFSDPRIPAVFCKNEINRCLNIMKKNGIIAVHDVFSDEYPLKEAFNSLLTDRSDIELITLPYAYGLGLIRYKGESKCGEVKDEFKRK